MLCFKCKNKLNLPNKIGFKETCPFCEADLHVCKNCKYYMPGKPNDCNVPNTEFVSDKEKYNFCEEFKFNKKINTQSNIKTKKDISKKLFKDSDDNDFENNSFDSLFKD
jgi:hypothetical protein